MNPNESPFEILGISRDAELEVVNAAYRALARKYHPDTNPGVPSDELNRRMVRINWAKAELERDLQGWRRREKAQEESRSGAGPHGKSLGADGIVPRKGHTPRNFEKG